MFRRKDIYHPIHALGNKLLKDKIKSSASAPKIRVNSWNVFHLPLMLTECFFCAVSSRKHRENCDPEEGRWHADSGAACDTSAGPVALLFGCVHIKRAPMRITGLTAWLTHSYSFCKYLQEVSGRGSAPIMGSRVNRKYALGRLSRLSK